MALAYSQGHFSVRTKKIWKVYSDIKYRAANPVSQFIRLAILSREIILRYSQIASGL